MTYNQRQPHLPDRSVDIPINQLATEFEDCREVDISILSQLEDRPCTVSFLSGQINHQPSYISQRLSVLQDAGIVIDLSRGFYEISGALVRGETINGEPAPTAEDGHDG